MTHPAGLKNTICITNASEHNLCNDLSESALRKGWVPKPLQSGAQPAGEGDGWVTASRPSKHKVPKARSNIKAACSLTMWCGVPLDECAFQAPNALKVPERPRDSIT